MEENEKPAAKRRRTPTSKKIAEMESSPSSGKRPRLSSPPTTENVAVVASQQPESFFYDSEEAVEGSFRLLAEAYPSFNAPYALIFKRKASSDVAFRLPALYLAMEKRGGLLRVKELR